MTLKHRTIFGLILISAFFSGTAFASSEGSLVNTPNVDFNDIGNALVSSGYSQSTSANGDVLIGTMGDPRASYSGTSGNWVYYND